MNARGCGWSAVGNSKAEAAFVKWNTSEAGTLTVGELILARDFAVLQGERKSLIDKINSDLRAATIKIVEERAK